MLEKITFRHECDISSTVATGISMWFGKVYQMLLKPLQPQQQDFSLCVPLAPVWSDLEHQIQGHNKNRQIQWGKSSTDHLCSIFIHFPNWLTSRIFQVTHRWLSIRFLTAPRSECAAHPAEVCPASSHGTCLGGEG